MKIIELLNWRYAAKAMNKEKIAAQKLHNILEAIRLTPTSSGLQPYELIVVSNQEVKEKIRPIAFNQRQIVECSDLVIFAAWDDYTEERINMMFDLTNEIRGGTNEGWENYRQFLIKSYVGRNPEENFNHAAKQAYIALGVAMLAAAEEKVDATPMEGFDPKALDELLGLKAQGLRSVLILPLGYRDSTSDWLVSLKKVRRPFEKFVRMIS